MQTHEFRRLCYDAQGDVVVKKLAYLEWIAAERLKWKTAQEHDGELNTPERNASFNEFLATPKS